MEHVHLDPESLERMLAEERSQDQNRNLLHQIAVCSRCYEVGGFLLELHKAGRLLLLFSSVDVALERSRVEAPRLLEKLLKFPQEVRQALIRGTRSFASWGLCELLCEESRRDAAGPPERALELSELAVLVADSIEDDQPAEARWLYQLRALSWGHLANARRAGGSLRTADEAFTVSDQWWEAGESGIGDALGYGSILLDLKASLRIAQRRFPEAVDLLDQSCEAFLGGDPEYRDRHLAGRALVQRAFAVSEMGEPESSIQILREAASLIDPNRDPRLNLCLQHNLLWNLTTVRRFQEGLEVLPEVRGLCQELGHSLDQVRLLWAEGRVSAGLGNVEWARQALLEVRQEFVSRGIGFDAALVSLDLAVLYIEDGRVAGVRELAEEMLAIFKSQDVHREALAAVALFQNAAALENATVELARQIAAYLERARLDPELRFSRGQA